MAQTVEEIIAAALELTDEDRLLLRKEDIAGELQRRSALWKTGEVTDIDSDELFGELRARRH